MRENKGITLVALIITIVVLLILAVVTVRNLNDDDIISQTTATKRGFEDEAEKEQIQYIVLKHETLEIASSLSDYLATQTGGTAVNNQNGTITLTLQNNNKYLIDTEGNVEKIVP